MGSAVGSLVQGSLLSTAFAHISIESRLLDIGPLIVRILSCPGAKEAVLYAENRPAEDFRAKRPVKEAGFPAEREIRPTATKKLD